MLKSLVIKGLRKYNNLRLDKLKNINFILGNNNIGKTTILEAIFTWACGRNFLPIFNVPLPRNRYVGIQEPYWIMDEILSFFNNKKELPLSLTLSGEDEGGLFTFLHEVSPSDLLSEYDSTYKKYYDKMISSSMQTAVAKGNENQKVLPGFVQIPTVNLAQWKITEINATNSYNEVSNYNVTYPYVGTSIKPHCLAKFIDLLSQVSIQENINIYSCLKRRNLLDKVTEEISKIFPTIKGFDILPYPNGAPSPISVVDIKGETLPIYAYGDGVQKWFYILGSIILNSDSIICIDEIDTGLHAFAQMEFCKHLVEYSSKYNTQLFVTTHNIEFVDKFLASVQETNSDLADSIEIITLRENAMRNLTANEAYLSRNEYNIELR